MTHIRLAALAAVLAAATSAAAQTRSTTDTDRRLAAREPTEYTKETWPTEVTRRPLTLAPGMLELTVPLNANLSDGAAFEPVFLNPSVYYGVTRDVTVGLRHFVGICLTGDDNGCDSVYDDVSVDTIWSIARGERFDAAVGAALNATSLDPFTLSGEARVSGRWRSDVLAITVAPQLNFGLTERDEGRSFISGGGGAGGGAATAFGNKEVLTIPVTAQLQATPMVAVSVGAALSGPLDPPEGGFGDYYSVPVSAAVDWTMSQALDLGASFVFTNLAGEDGSADERFGKVYARARF